MAGDAATVDGSASTGTPAGRSSGVDYSLVHQKVEGLRPDVFVVDDRTRPDQNLGSVEDVIRMYLGKRPVFVDRLDGGSDGMAALSKLFEMQDFTLPNGSTIKQVTNAKGTQ